MCRYFFLFWLGKQFTKCGIPYKRHLLANECVFLNVFRHLVLLRWLLDLNVKVKKEHSCDKILAAVIQTYLVYL